MADNMIQYGFRWSTAANGRPMPTPEVRIVATSASFDVNSGASNVGLGAGDLVKLVSDGTVTLCDGSEGAGGTLTPYGVVVAVRPYYNATTGRMTPSEVLPSDTAWGTVQERRSEVLVVPVDAGTWEVDVDENTTATTEANYIDMIGENVDHILTGASGATRAHPRLDISSNATTNTLIWRIVGISPSKANQDFSGKYVKLLVRANVASISAFSATGV